jgi:RNA polymerase sigma factor (sigma-70 family)
MSRFFDISLDDTALRLAAGGDRAAQRALYDQVAGPMLALIRRVVRDRAAADDLFQDSMIRVLQHLADYRGEAPLGAWVRQVTLRQCLMHLRSPWQRARRALSTITAGADQGEYHAPWAVLDRSCDLPLSEVVDLDRALACLSDTARTVLWLHDVEGLTHQEIAAAFHRSAGFSKSQLARAHALLRAQLRDADPPAAPLFSTDIAAQGQLP